MLNAAVEAAPKIGPPQNIGMLQALSLVLCLFMPAIWCNARSLSLYLSSPHIFFVSFHLLNHPRTQILSHP